MISLLFLFFNVFIKDKMFASPFFHPTEQSKVGLPVQEISGRPTVFHLYKYLHIFLHNYLNILRWIVKNVILKFEFITEVLPQSKSTISYRNKLLSEKKKKKKKRNKSGLQLHKMKLDKARSLDKTVGVTAENRLQSLQLSHSTHSLTTSAPQFSLIFDILCNILFNIRKELKIMSHDLEF